MTANQAISGAALVAVLDKLYSLLLGCPENGRNVTGFFNMIFDPYLQRGERAGVTPGFLPQSQPQHSFCWFV